MTTLWWEKGVKEYINVTVISIGQCLTKFSICQTYCESFNVITSAPTKPIQSYLVPNKSFRLTFIHLIPLFYKL